MSEIIEKLKSRMLGHIIRTDNGNYYYVDSNVTTDCGPETMAFPYDIKNSEVADWTEVYCRRHSDAETMKQHHNWVVRNFEEVLEEK